MVKVLRWQLDLLEWKFQEPVGGSPWDLNTGSGHRLVLLLPCATGHAVTELA